MINETLRKDINVDKVNILPIFSFKEGDNALLKLALFKNSVEFDITGQTVRLGAKTKNNLIEQIDGFTISKNNLDIKLKNSILVPGIIEIDLEMEDAKGTMTTASFFITVNQKVLNDEAVEATNEFDTFTKTVDKIESDYTGLRRIIIDENQAASLQDQINNVNSSLDNIINNGVKLNNEPQIKDIPKVYFNGDITGMSKDVEKKMRIRYSSETLQFDEYCKMKWQGSSSLANPKKNYTIKLFKDSECTSKNKRIFRNWVEANKFCLKANWIDSTHARNIVTAKLSRELYNEKLPIDCQGTIDGFPIWVYVNGVLQGLYTWNIPKDGEQMYGMSENNPNHLMFVANRNANGSTTQDWASQFRTLATDINEDTANGWEEEFPQTCTSENMAKLNRLISFVKDSTDEEFKRDFSQYMDLDYAISYWIYAYVGCMADNLGNNMVIITYDGLKWYPVFYDVDSVWGLKWNGATTLSDTYQCPEQYQENRSLLWEKLVRNFPKEIYDKYKELRKNVLSEEYIIEKFERFIDIIPNEKYTKDQTIWSNIPSKNYNIDQIRSYVLKRMSYCDVEFANLVNEPIIITGLSIETSTKTFVDGIKTLTVEYIPSNTTQKGLIWESSNPSVASVNNGVITGVSEGECTITATSTHNPDIKATCSVSVISYDFSDFTIEQNGEINDINFINQNGAIFDETKGCYTFTGDEKYIQVDFSGLVNEFTLELIIDDNNVGNTVIAEGKQVVLDRTTVLSFQSDLVKEEQAITFRVCGHGLTEDNGTYFKPIVGTKYHLIYTINKNNNILKSFINGVKEEKDFTNYMYKPDLSGLTGMVFGSRSGMYGCKNNIYLIKIYDRVLSDDEALNRYNQCKSKL